MRFILIIMSAVVGILHGQEKSEKPHLQHSASKSAAEKFGINAEEEKKFEAAKARLPSIDAFRIEEIVTVLRSIEYPISLETLRAKLGGPDSLVWRCTGLRQDKDRLYKDANFLVANPKVGEGSYELIADYESVPIGEKPTMVRRARLCYNSPQGWLFFAESMGEMLQGGVTEEKPNQAAEPRSPSRAGSP